MIGRIWTAYLIELAKAVRTKTTYVGPVLMLAAVVATAAYRIRQGQALDFSFIAFATSASLAVPGLLLVLTFCAGLIASELHSGTIRMLLIRPIRRSELLVAKWCLGFTYAVVLLGVVALSAWIGAWTTGGAAGVTLGGEVVYTQVEMERAYLYGMALSLFPMAAAVAYAILISTLLPSPGPALATTVGSWLLIDLIKYPLHVQTYLFWTFWSTPWQPFRDFCDGLPADWMNGLIACLVTAILTTLICLSASVLVLRRRNV